MTQLVPMRAQAFAAFVQSSIRSYAEANVAAGRWLPDQALARSQQEFARLLPQGLATPDQYLFEILDAAGGQVVGILWLAVETRFGVRSGFIYDVEIHAPFRRQGHAENAFQALEDKARELGLDSVGLHVFANNAAARALYAKLGFHETGVHMRKALAPLDADRVAGESTG